MLGLAATPEGELRADPTLPAGVQLIELAGLGHRRRRYSLRAGVGGFDLLP